MKAVKIIAILVGIYVFIVVLFESLLGYFQPEAPGTAVITTTDDSGVAADRVIARLESEGKVYVAVNHWPRAWYGDALDNPAVALTYDGEEIAYTAVEIDGAEYDQVDSEHALPGVFRVLTGFPPRRILRLDPR